MLTSLYREATGHRPDKVERLPQAGSNRRYYRLSDHPTLIGVEGSDINENKAFIYLANHFYRLGLPVPQVVAADSDCTCYLQEDLGSTSLFDAIASGRTTGAFSRVEVELLEKTIRSLARIQCVGDTGLDYDRCYPRAEFDRRSVMWDLNYFKYCFLKPSGLEFSDDELEDDFNRLADMLLEVPIDSFMYRDFQSRNVMLVGNEPYFIDFQGGRRGPLYYDVASFLWQAKANFSNSLREHLLDVYLVELSKYRSVDRNNFLSRLPIFVLFRTMQVLGAYGFRGNVEHKAHFIQSIPFAVANLRNLLPEVPTALRYLRDVLAALCELDKYAAPDAYHGLTVTVTSFSFKKGIPDDRTGNGGGFVFDCRAIHNPGRYDQYKTLTGMDEPVRRFLEEDGEILDFLSNAYDLVDSAVKRYISRGFSNLMVSFGCTGGRHRSVYSADSMARHLADLFDIRIVLVHREQGIKRIFLPQ